VAFNHVEKLTLKNGHSEKNEMKSYLDFFCLLKASVSKSDLSWLNMEVSKCKAGYKDSLASNRLSP
jgi:hypothetical protein